MIDTLGVERTVQVNASTYGYDNSVTLEVIAKLGQKRARGVGGIAPDAGEQAVRRLHDDGTRGVRLSTMVKGYGGAELLDRFAQKIKPFGWHVQLHVEKVAELAALETQLLALPTPIVFDHLGRVRGGEGVGSPGFQALLRIVRQRDDCWVKLSSWYRLSDSGPPAYADMKPLVQALIAARADHVVWGSNWPHPIWDGSCPMKGNTTPSALVPTRNAFKRILVANPAQLYGFD